MNFFNFESEDSLKTNTAGFTLIEVMIVVAITGVLASISIPNYIKYREKALSNSIATVKRENLLLLEDIEETVQACGQQTGIEAKLKGFQDRAYRCRVQLDTFQLIGDSTNEVGTGQCRQLVRDNPLSANECL